MTERKRHVVNWERAKALSGWAVAIVLSLSLGGYVLATNPTFNTIIGPGSMVSTAGFTVFTDGTNYFVRNGQTGAIDENSASASTSIQYAVDQLTQFPGSTNTHQATIHILPGNYSMDTTVTISATHPTIEGEGFVGTGGSILYSTGANPVFNVTTTDVRFAGLDIVVTSGGKGIVLYGSTGVVIRDCFISSPSPFTITGHGAGIAGYGALENVFDRVLVYGIWDGYNMSSKSGVQPNFNQWSGGKVKYSHNGIYIDGGSVSGIKNVIDSVDISIAYNGIVLARASETTVSNNWFESITNYSLVIGKRTANPAFSQANVIMQNNFGSANGLIDNAWFTMVHDNNFNTGNPVTIGNVSVYSNFYNNNGYYPGRISSPFGTVGWYSIAYVGLCGANCTAAPAASTAYSAQGMNLYVTSSGGTGISITIKNFHGTTVYSGVATITNFYLPNGYSINFGAFSGAPTVTVDGAI